MKFICKQQLLVKSLNIVSKAVTARTTLPIMKGILLSVKEENILTMSASDFYISIEKSLEVLEAEPGEIVVQSKLFGDIIRKLPNDDVYIELQGETLYIKCQNSEFKIVGLSANDFPKINQIDENNNSIIFDREKLKNMIKKTSFSASIDEAKGVLTGVLIELEENSMNLVALDGFRIAITRETMVNKEGKKIIIPAKIINELNKILIETSDEEYEVKMILTDKKALFVMGKMKVVLSLIEGDFIKYKDILPKQFESTIIINRSEMLTSIERASLLAKEGKNNLIKLELVENKLLITSKSEEGNVKEEINITKEGNDIEIGFNSKYLLDVLKTIEDEEIKLCFNKSVNPCEILPISDNSFEYLILPVRITNN